MSRRPSAAPAGRGEAARRTGRLQFRRARALAGRHFDAADPSKANSRCSRESPVPSEYLKTLLGPEMSEVDRVLRARASIPTSR